MATPGPRVIGWRGTSASRDPVVPLVVDALAGVDCTVCGHDAPSLDVTVTHGGKHYRVDISAAIADVAARVRAAVPTMPASPVAPTQSSPVAAKPQVVKRAG